MGRTKPTVQDIWDQNEIDDYVADTLAMGRVWRLASDPLFSPEPWEPGLSSDDDSVQYVALYKAVQKDSRHWQVFGIYDGGKKDWEHVGWLVR